MESTPSLGPTAVCQLLCTLEVSGPDQRGLFPGPEPVPMNTLLGATPPRTGSSGFPIKGPKGKTISGVGSRGQSLGHPACGWRPVGCRLAKGTSLFPTQSWQDSGFNLLQPQPAKSMLPWSSGYWPVHWGHPSGEGGAGGAGRAPRLARCGRPPCSADWWFHVWLPVAQTAPTRHWGTSRLPPKLEHTAQALRGSTPGPKDAGAGGEHRPLELAQGSPAWFSLVGGRGRHYTLCS